MTLQSVLGSATCHVMLKCHIEIDPVQVKLTNSCQFACKIA